MTARAGVFALVLVVVLAGCFGNPGATPTDPNDGPSIETPSPSPTEAQLEPAGVRGGTITNVTALLEQYQGSVTNVGFVAEVRAGNDSIEYTYATDGSRMIRVGDGSTTIWTNGTASLTREVDGNNVTYSTPPEGVPRVSTLTRSPRIRDLLLAATGERPYERTGTTQCGDVTCVVLAADTSRRYDNFTAEIHVDETGVIHRFDAEGVSKNEGRYFEFRFSIRQLGTESIERPDWVEEGLNSTR